MGSRHSVAEAHPGTLNAAAFATAAGVEDGVVPSGYPIAKGGDLFVPYNPAATGGNTLYGFSIDDRDISNGNETTAVMWHGRIKVANLPITFTPPADAGAFTYEN
jgi:hypothetical protein